MINRLRDKRDKLKAKLMKHEEDLKKRETLELKYLKQKDKLDKLDELRINCSLALRCANDKAIEYRDSTVGYIEDNITEVLNMAFNQENYKASIQFDVKRDSDLATLNLMQNSTVTTPALNGGRLSQQLVSCSAVAAINKLRGSLILALDEPASSSDKDTINDLSPFISAMVEEGMQVFLIEHKDGLYDKLKRREFQFEKEYLGIEGVSVITEEEVE